MVTTAGSLRRVAAHAAVVAVAGETEDMPVALIEDARKAANAGGLAAVSRQQWDELARRGASLRTALALRRASFLFG